MSANPLFANITYNDTYNRMELSIKELSRFGQGREICQADDEKLMTVRKHLGNIHKNSAQQTYWDFYSMADILIPYEELHLLYKNLTIPDKITIHIWNGMNFDFTGLGNIDRIFLYCCPKEIIVDAEIVKIIALFNYSLEDPVYVEHLYKALYKDRLYFSELLRCRPTPKSASSYLHC